MFNFEVCFKHSIAQAFATLIDFCCPFSSKLVELSLFNLLFKTFLTTRDDMTSPNRPTRKTTIFQNRLTQLSPGDLYTFSSFNLYNNLYIKFGILGFSESWQTSAQNIIILVWADIINGYSPSSPYHI